MAALLAKCKHAGRISAAYTELAVVENSAGINFQDRVTSVFPEPKFR